MNDLARPDGFRFVLRLDSRLSQADASMLSGHAGILSFVGAGLDGYWRALALPLEESMAALGADLQAGRVTLDVHGPAGDDGPLDVAVRFASRDEGTLVFQPRLFRGDRCLATAEVTLDIVDATTRAPTAVPASLVSIIDRFEGGEAICDILAGDWQRLGREAALLRRAVFVREQGIPESLEWDELDATALHMVLRNGLGRPAATGRLLVEGPGLGRIGRMAVHGALRGAGHGTTVLRALERAARERGDGEVMLHAQFDAREFYRRLGYLPHGEPFEEAGIVHLEMRRTLTGAEASGASG
jgi:predicted GNAT family N-acyltransferase/acyl-CoA thioesterase FadM